MGDHWQPRGLLVPFSTLLLQLHPLQHPKRGPGRVEKGVRLLIAVASRCMASGRDYLVENLQWVLG